MDGFGLTCRIDEKKRNADTNSDVKLQRNGDHVIGGQYENAFYRNRL
jgi:hypothetical protein